MTTSQVTLNDELCTPECRQLALDLGFTHYPTSITARPYLQHIISKCEYSRDRKEFLWLFSKIMSLASPILSNAAVPRDIQAIISELENDTNNRYFLRTGSTNGVSFVKDTVFLILGLWSMMGRSFEPDRNLPRPVLWAFNARINSQLPAIDPLTHSLKGLVEGSGLIPNSSSLQNMPPSVESNVDPNTFYPMSSQSIPARALNLSKLSTLAGVHIHWTDNISRHLLLSLHAGTLYIELYAYPCTLDNACRTEEFRSRTGVPIAYMDEISKSYATLFNPVGFSRVHGLFNWFGANHFFCWCLACTSYRTRRRAFRALKSKKYVLSGIFYDPSLENVSVAPRAEWNRRTYPRLWSRIMELESALQDAKPWSFWVLFRDRREKLPFWTFLFATFILLLTLVQVLVGIAQLVSGFKD